MPDPTCHLETDSCGAVAGLRADASWRGFKGDTRVEVQDAFLFEEAQAAVAANARGTLGKVVITTI